MAAAAASQTAIARGAPPVARTGAGKVQGETSQGIHVFKGIPYGADTRPRRFQPPIKPTPWSGIRKTIAYGPACPQRSPEPNQSEDCLYLNVWTLRRCVTAASAR